MKALSQRALVDISFTGKVTGTEKIYFQRKNEFSFKLIPLMIKKIIYSKEMEKIAAERIKNAIADIINGGNSTKYNISDIKKCVGNDVFNNAYSEVEIEVLNEQKKTITNNESNIESQKEDRVPNTEQASLKNEFENEKISEETIENLITLMNKHNFSVDRNFLLELNKETNNGTQVVAKDRFTIPTCQNNLANFYKVISCEPDGEYKNLIMLNIDKLLYQLSAPEVQYIPPTIQPTEPKIEKIITPINKEIVNLENEKKSKQELYGPLIDYLSESTKYSLLGKKEKNYSNSEVQLINSMINTKFNAMNKQFNSEHKDQCLKLLSKIRNEIEGNPKIQNQQQILDDIKALTKKINMIRNPR